MSLSTPKVLHSDKILTGVPASPRLHALNWDYLKQKGESDGTKEKKDTGVNSTITKFLQDSWQYYAVMRFMGYFFESTYSPSYKRLKAKGQSVLQQSQEQSALRRGEFHSGTENLQVIEKDSKHIINYIEAVAFSTITAIGFIVDRKLMNHQLGEAAAFSLGMDPKEVDIWHLEKSDNIVVAKQMQRFNWQYAIRTSSSLAFLHSLTPALVLSAVNIVAEAMYFSRDNTFNKLQKMLSDVQGNNLTGDDIHRDTVLNLQRAYQLMMKENYSKGLRTLTADQVKGLNPIFTTLATAIIDHKVNINDLVHIFGSQMINPADVKQSFTNVQEVIEYGVGELARAKAAQKHCEEYLPQKRDSVEDPKHSATHGRPVYLDNSLVRSQPGATAVHNYGPQSNTASPVIRGIVDSGKRKWDIPQAANGASLSL